ncbi:L-amino-acid oxidase [Dichotomocladium elegans]|nr:L-amino-acid oxidase [Dichotomocladium elegans]
MLTPAVSLFLLATAALQAIGAPTSNTASLTVDETLKADSLANIYLDYGSKEAFTGSLTLAFVDCATGTTRNIIGSTEITDEFKPTKFIWSVPADAKDGCIVAKDASGELIAASSPLTVEGPRIKKRGHPEFEGMHFDAVEYHNKQMSKRSRVHASDKSAKIGIVGAGMAGLFSGLLLEQAGFKNYEILEANDRLGGRVHTVYFENNTTSLVGNKDSVRYQEMGPMRFPVSWTYKNKTLPITDHDIVYQMADELNSLTDDEYQIEFIKWVQKSPNNLNYHGGKRLPNGKVPTAAQVAADPSLASTGVPELSSKVEEATKEFFTEEWYKLMSSDLYAAHSKALEEGYDDWSEYGWLHNKMGLSLNASDYATGLDASQIWHDMYDTFTFSATNWRTVQGGLTRLARAYEPVLGDKVKFNVRVSKLAFEDDDTISVQWKNSPYDETYDIKKYDNVIVSVPFSVVRTWHLPSLPYTLNSAINHLGYSQACKVSMEFKTRFWEHYENPILGGCDSTDLLAGSVCYPSNNLGSDGPGIMLASYASGDLGLRFASMTEDEHVARVLEDITELHGDIVKEQYTGNYDRVCWILDEFQSGAWADAHPGQHKLYMPSYFEPNQGLVFVGEHTDIKHAWISAALESAVRGVVMTLVDHGHAKEAKALVRKWNAKWMKI